MQLGKFFREVRPMTADAMVVWDLGWKKTEKQTDNPKIKVLEKILGIRKERLTKRAYEEDIKRL